MLTVARLFWAVPKRSVGLLISDTPSQSNVVNIFSKIHDGVFRKLYLNKNCEFLYDILEDISLVMYNKIIYIKHELIIVVNLLSACKGLLSLYIKVVHYLILMS